MTDSSETFRVKDSFPAQMTTCVKYMRERLNRRFANAGYNVTAEQWILLLHLADQDGISQQTLADRYDRTKVSALNLLKKLEKNGLVIRRPDPVDGRTNRVYLTPEGRKLQRSLIPLAKENVASMSAGITAGEIEQLKSIVAKIMKNLKS